MTIRRSAWVFLAALSLPGVSTSMMAQENGILSGTVFEPSGVAVANSPVTLRWNDLGAPMSWDGVPRKRKRPQKKSSPFLPTALVASQSDYFRERGTSLHIATDLHPYARSSASMLATQPLSN